MECNQVSVLLRALKSFILKYNIVARVPALNPRNERYSLRAGPVTRFLTPKVARKSGMGMTTEKDEFVSLDPLLDGPRLYVTLLQLHLFKSLSRPLLLAA